MRHDPFLPPRFLQPPLPWIFAALIVLASCDKPARDTCPEPEPAYAIPLGEKLSFCLSSNPSTGYAWAWTNRRAARAVDTSGWSFRSDEPGVPGAGGRETWTFTARNRGTDSIRMEYRREGEPNTTVQTRTVVLRVN